ncbi:hypothetical protein AB3R30_14130 [Leptolyngbyaceae cyanobacterium UHCC 1019]
MNRQERQIFIKTMQGLVSGDGDIRGRMNAAPGSVQPFSEPIMQAMVIKAEEMRSRNLTPQQVEAEILANVDEANRTTEELDGNP